MERKPIASSNLKSVGYDKENTILEIEFSTGKVYTYNNVPEDIYQELIINTSPGRYFRNNIRNIYG